MSRVKKLYRDLGLFKIDIQDWEIPDEGITLLWGPSGAGKSTILHALLGLDPQAKVSWEMDGVDIGLLPPFKRQLGAVLQNPSLFPHMTAEENICFAVSDQPRQNWEAEYQKLLLDLNLQDCAKTPAALLSGGEAQRVALARALIYRPKMLLLDEPFSSLDLPLREGLRGLLRKVTRERACPVLLVSHDPVDREELADRVTQIAGGQLF